MRDSDAAARNGVVVLIPPHCGHSDSGAASPNRAGDTFALWVGLPLHRPDRIMLRELVGRSGRAGLGQVTSQGPSGMATLIVPKQGKSMTARTTRHRSRLNNFLEGHYCTNCRWNGLGRRMFFDQIKSNGPRFSCNSSCSMEMDDYAVSR